MRLQKNSNFPTFVCVEEFDFDRLPLSIKYLIKNPEMTAGSQYIQHAGSFEIQRAGSLFIYRRWISLEPAMAQI